MCIHLILNSMRYHFNYLQLATLTTPQIVPIKETNLSFKPGFVPLVINSMPFSLLPTTPAPVLIS